MIIQGEKRIAELEGFDEANKPKNFQIKQNARAFEILSSNIYSDKVTAVLRELGCNAFDAHVAAKKDSVPFEVHLPNSFEPWFSVRDFGIGLDHDSIMNLYTTYFDTTKGADNSMIGGLGLGSKSPFAYTDQFTVTARFDGTKRVYSAYVDEGGAPAILLLSQEPTDECNGLEVQLPVQQRDFHEFQERARRVFHRFPVQPTVTGAKCDLTKVEYIMTGTNYRVRHQNSDYHTSFSGCYAIQGTVAYPIEYDSLGLDEYSMKQFVSRSPIDIDFPIGSVNITASREKLNYDRITKATVVAALRAVIEDLPRQFEKDLVKCTTLWQAKTMFCEMEQMGSELFKLAKKQIVWNGQTLDSGYLTCEFFDMKDAVDVTTGLPILRDVLDPNTGFVTGKKVPVREKDYWGKVVVYDGGSLRSRRASAPDLHSTYLLHVKREDQKLVLIDSKVGNRTNFIKHNYQGASYNTKIVVFEVEDLDRRLPQLLKVMGDIPEDKFIRTSTLNEVPKVIKVPGTQKKEKKVYKVEHCSSHGSIDLKEVTIDMALGGYYLTVFNKMPVHPDFADDAKDQRISTKLTSIIGNMKEAGLLKKLDGGKIEGLYAFNHHIRREVKKDPLWIDINSVVKAYWTEVLDKKKNKSMIALRIADKIGSTQWMRHMMEDWIANPAAVGTRSSYDKVMRKFHLDMVMAAAFLGAPLVTKEDVGKVGLKARVFMNTLEYVRELYALEPTTESFVKPTDFSDLVLTIHKNYPILWKMFQDGDGWKSDAFKWKECRAFVILCDAKPLLAQQINLNTAKETDND